MPYLDVILAPVKTDHRAAYEAFLDKIHPLIREFGALEVHDFWGDDVPEGEVTSFPMAVKCAADETVAVGWMVWPSKAAREAGMEKMMNDPRMADLPMPFDGKRMVFGGFTPLLQTV